MGTDAFGTQWAISTDGGTVYTPVGQVTEIAILDVSVDTIETTTHSSAGQWRTYISGMKDGGELGMSVNYDPVIHATLWDEIGTDDLKHRITLTDAGAATVVFTGIITKLSSTAPMEGLMTAEVSIKVSGAPVITP